jgi:radical SAM superfamily enzyme YgiQ (UPF0313 family)
MGRSLYLINPKAEHASYFGAEVFERYGCAPGHAIADLSTPTVAALAPADWQVTICDEYVQPIDFATDAEIIGITGKVNQGSRMIAVAEAFRARGKTVVIGGPYASLSPENLRAHCDVLLVGELESIAAEVFGDLTAGTARAEYVADKPSLDDSPLPRFDLYPNDRALSGCVQTSRGCPFECEFCDVIQYLGRKQRHKGVGQIVAELDLLYQLGVRAVFLADDNFTAYRKRAKEVLSALAEWNADRSDGPVAFHTQVSIDAARDPELLDLCARAGLTRVFIGIETPNEESLRETGKRQNVGVNLIDQIQAFLDCGISVTAGMIVGFDHDGLDIFERQYRFAMATPVPLFTLVALVAPAATPLHERMRVGGRLLVDGSESQGVWNTNISPVLMTREQQFEGLQRLGNALYRPEAFAQRVVAMIERLGPQRGPFRNGGKPHRERAIEREAGLVIRRLIASGAEERKMWKAIQEALVKNREAGPMVMNSLFSYAQLRALYDAEGYWRPELEVADWLTGAAPRQVAVASMVSAGATP